MQRLLWIVIMAVFPLAASSADELWEKQDGYYYLTKNSKECFSAAGAGGNKFSAKYLRYDGIDFLVRGAQGWHDYGRLDLEGNKLFFVPIGKGMKVDALHFLAGGNFGNRYEHDSLLSLYGDKYFYAVITVIFAYQDESFAQRCVPVFWDWFRLGSGTWSKEGATIKSLGSNPVRKDCSIFHITFSNPHPGKPLKDILVTDSWISDRPFSEIFAVTLKSSDSLEAAPRKNKAFEVVTRDASKESPDVRTEWLFDDGLDGWICGTSPYWDAEAAWKEESYGKRGVVSIPACNWAGDKFSWIEKKVALPAWDEIIMRFQRHSAEYSELDKRWSDGELKVSVSGATVYEQLYSGEWSTQALDLSAYKGQTVIIRFQNHGAGTVRFGKDTSPACDAEDALIDDIRLCRE